MAVGLGHCAINMKKRAKKESMMNRLNDDLIYRLRKRADIRRQIPSRKSVQNGEPDRIADLLEEAADAIDRLEMVILAYEKNDKDRLISFIKHLKELS
jgi:hypothetical protein